MRKILAAITAWFGLVGCGSGGGAGAGGSTAVESDGESAGFVASPLQLGDILWITPLGKMNPPGHTLPTDHIYFYWDGAGISNPVRPVYTPADGTVTYLLKRSPTDYRIDVNVSEDFRYYLDHVIPVAGIQKGVAVAGGQYLGTTSPAAFALDLGVIDYGITLTGFANPARYPEPTLHAGAPLQYFSGSLQEELYALVNGSDKDGKIDWDIPGRLVGNWFHESLPVGESSGKNAWGKQLAFVYDPEDSTKVTISIGGTVSAPALFNVPASSPDPADVTPESGIVAYLLSSGSVLVVQMTGPSSIQAEVVAQGVTKFSTLAQTYVR